MKQIAFVFFFTISINAFADDANDTEAVRTAISHGLEIVQKAAANYPKHRKCFSCHHQTLPLFAMTKARSVGFEIDEELLKSQVEFTRKSFESRREQLRAGEQIGGRAATVSFGLWTLEIAGEKPDELSTDMVTYLLKVQGKEGFWRPQSSRPPLEDSFVSCTSLSAYGLRKFGNDEQQEEIKQAFARAKEWLTTVKLESHEDYIGKLGGLPLLGGTKEQFAEVRQQVLDRQNSDGGWGQLDDAPSDAYATGETLYILLQSRMTPDDEPVARGISFLLSTQEEDGSWHVKTRSKPIQVFFDNGDPHGKDQFISVTSTSWAVAALAQSLRRPKASR